jgi:hypothetical protein
LSISRQQTTHRLSTAPARYTTPTVRAGKRDDGDAPLARLAELRCAYCGLSHAGPCGYVVHVCGVIPMRDDNDVFSAAVDGFLRDLKPRT